MFGVCVVEYLVSTFPRAVVVPPYPRSPKLICSDRPGQSVIVVKAELRTFDVQRLCLTRVGLF
jgi:hypothetical protein